jgi:hypothetical protein
MHKEALCDDSARPKRADQDGRKREWKAHVAADRPGPCRLLTCDDQREERTHNGHPYVWPPEGLTERRRTRRGRDGSSRKHVWAAAGWGLRR